MMKNKNVLLLSIRAVLLLMVLVVLVFDITYAWLVSYKETGDLTFKILQIDSVVNLYQGTDTNGNGVLDLLEKTNTYKSEKDASDSNYGKYLSYNEYYYMEKYDFSLKDSKYALSKDSSANLLNTITLENMAPSKIYTVKIETINYSEYANNIYFAFADTTDIDSTFLKQIKLRFACVECDTSGATETVTCDFTEWTPFLAENSSTYTGLTINSSANPYVLPSTNDYMSGSIVHHGKKDFWIQIKLDETATVSHPETFTLPELKITFEIPEGAISSN